MNEATQVKLLRSAMILGITLLVCGHILLAITFASDSIGHQGFILGAALSAFGVILSLPTKIYLTLLLMEHEESKNPNFTRSAEGQERRRSSVAHIRTATEDDALNLSVLAKQTFIDTFAADNSEENMRQHCDATYSEAMQRDEIDDPNRLTLLATHEGHLIGFVQLRWANTPDCVPAKSAGELQRLYVDRDWHGKGIAQDLMAAALDVFAKRGNDVVWLGVWEHNPRAIAFYKKLGFREVGSHVFPLGTDPQRDLIFMRELQAD